MDAEGAEDGAGGVYLDGLGDLFADSSGRADENVVLGESLEAGKFLPFELPPAAVGHLGGDVGVMALLQSSATSEFPAGR